MRAVVSKEVHLNLRDTPKGELQRMIDRLLEFIQTGYVKNQKLGLCSNLDVPSFELGLSNTPISTRQSKKAGWTNNKLYSLSLKGEKYKGEQLRNRRKLARKMMQILQQVLVEREREQ